MKIDISKDWCLRMAQHEGDTEIGAGRLAIDPVFDGERIPADGARRRVRTWHSAGSSI